MLNSLCWVVNFCVVTFIEECNFDSILCNILNFEWLVWLRNSLLTSRLVFGILMLIRFNKYLQVNSFSSMHSEIFYYLFRYGRPYNTEYRLIIENLSTRCSWQVCVNDMVFSTLEGFFLIELWLHSHQNSNC